MMKPQSRIKRGFRSGVAAIAALALCAMVPLASSALAYSGYGAGTSSSPYPIGTCAQLEGIANHMAANYALVRDLNCQGANIGYIGSSDFSGTLDGQNHTITNFTASSGLFSGLSGATIENLNLISGTISGTGEEGSIAGVVDSTSSITNVHSSLTVNSSGGYTGGLVGAAFGVLNVSQSSYTGSLNVNSSAYEGGLIGAWEGTGSTMNDSYTAGSFNFYGDTYSGGLVGGMFAGSSVINNSYSASTININTGTNDGGLVGGLFGSSSQINYSFAANAISGSGTTIGAVYGSVGGGPGGTISNGYYDSNLAGGLGCSGSGSVSGCTAVNVANATPSYFKGNSTNAPLSHWSFPATWITNTSAVPTLANLSGFTVIPTPINNGDADGDGTTDNLEPNVLSLESASNLWSTVVIPTSNNCDITGAASSTPASTTSYIFPLGSMTDFNVYCPTAGTTVPVTIILDQQYNTTGWILLSYNSSAQKYSKVSGAGFGSVVVGGVTKTTVTYSLTDGGPYDADGSANGVIMDPIAIATAVPGAPDTGIGSRPSSTPLLISFGSILNCLAVSLLVLRRHSQS